MDVNTDIIINKKIAIKMSCVNIIATCVPVIRFTAGSSNIDIRNMSIDG